MITFEQVAMQLGHIPHNIPIPATPIDSFNPRELAKIKRGQIIEAVKAGICTAPEIAKHLGMPYPTTKALLADMVDTGLLNRKEAHRACGWKMFKYTASTMANQGEVNA